MENRKNRKVKHKIGIVGVGFVGQACETAFMQMPSTEVLIHDKFKPTDSLRTVVSRSNILFVCLPTPMQEDGSCDTSIVAEGVRQISATSHTPKTIVIKSTVPPGTTDALQKKFPGQNIFFNPEFLTEKHFIEDFANQKTIVLGAPPGRDPKYRSWLTSFYQSFAGTQNKPAEIVWTQAKTAELFKYTTNCFLAAKVSFFNEIHEICRAVGVQYDQLHLLLDRDARIGKTHTQVPGHDGKFGFGGSCFPKDLNALMALAKEKGVDPLVLESVWSKNLMVRDGCEWESLPQVNGHYASG